MRGRAQRLPASGQAHRTPHVLYAWPAKTPSPATDSSHLLLAQRYLQRVRSIPSILRGCSECTTRFLFLVTVTFDLCPWHSNSYERRIKHVFRVNLTQIRSAVPAIRCRMRVPRIELVSISRIWRINGRQTITVNSGVLVDRSSPDFYTM